MSKTSNQIDLFSNIGFAIGVLKGVALNINISDRKKDAIQTAIAKLNKVIDSLSDAEAQ